MGNIYRLVIPRTNLYGGVLKAGNLR